jgi:hypothetical protein
MLRRDRPQPPGAQGRAEIETWRAATKRVSRAWNAWLAAEGRRRAQAYAAYLDALAQEELAAARMQRASTRLEHSGG